MSTRRKNKIYAAVTADVVGSRSSSDFRRLLGEKLRQISDMHLKQKMILRPYTVTTWDEFQSVTSDLVHIPQVILDIRRLFYPFGLRIGVGIGQVTKTWRKPVNVWGGKAFELARKALENLKGGKRQKFDRFTEIRSGNEHFDRVAKLVYDLNDALVQRVTEREWETINSLMETGRQDKTARQLRIDTSTVTRNLQRGFYWERNETVKGMREVIKAHFS